MTIEGDKLRVSSASRDALQEVIAFLKGQDYRPAASVCELSLARSAFVTNIDVTAAHCADGGSAAPSVCFVTLGCAKNEVDSAEMTKKIQAAGFLVVDDASEADAVVVNTCSFIQAATEESIDVIFEICGLDTSRPATPS